MLIRRDVWNERLVVGMVLIVYASIVATIFAFGRMPAEWKFGATVLLTIATLAFIFFYHLLRTPKGEGRRFRSLRKQLRRLRS